MDSAKNQVGYVSEPIIINYRRTNNINNHLLTVFLTDYLESE